ncbi:MULTISPECIES: ABC transporter ATP-binding protein [unclassified Dietzia]|uniref:ABC transporter ATP-binding protein n=1 Tax=unclassified Dietzia TaxID=2617939 RepID=UPI0015F941B8|nr:MULTISPECIES: ABC transporter ATP-binding protein [unclassified Dietzia]MBB1050925.1 ABC transporter ATP-binding protein [Dietzia sp. CW19]MBB1052738.1 ABC transporter ATP-binding protein [Dietzia sp. B44]MBC7297105.1 ABC transporter ATP-binding protein [Dietzia sp.]
MSGVGTMWRIAGAERVRVLRGVGWRIVQSLLGGLLYGVLITLVVHLARGGQVDESRAVQVTAVAVVTLLGQLLASYLAARDSWLASYQVSAHARVWVLEHLLRVPVPMASGRRRGEIQALLTGDMQQIEDFLSEGLPKLGQALGLPVFVIAAAAVYDPVVALVLGGAVVAAIPATVWAGIRTTAAARERTALQAESSARFVDVLTGITVWRVLAAPGRIAEVLRATALELRDSSVRMLGKLIPPLMLASAVLMAGVPVLMAVVAGRGTEVAIGFLLVSIAVYRPLLATLSVGEQWHVTRAALERLRSVAEIPQLSEPSEAKTPRGVEVRFDGVGYDYPDGTPALQGIDVALPEKGMVAVVGHSGSGKSSLGGLLSRFDDPTAGSVKIGGVDVREIAPHTLAATVTQVFQQTHLVPGTVAENIALGRPDANRADVIDAARRAQLHTAIIDLPHGYDTRLGEDGAGLSGGQRQRLAIARALLVDAPIVVLDEPTSALDTRTESEVSEVIAELARGRSVLLIAHRLSTIIGADEIVVLQQGRVVERGTHAELVSSDGRYRRMWDRPEPP